MLHFEYDHFSYIIYRNFAIFFPVGNTQGFLALIQQIVFFFPNTSYSVKNKRCPMRLGTYSKKNTGQSERGFVLIENNYRTEELNVRFADRGCRFSLEGSKSAVLGQGVRVPSGSRVL